MRSAEMGSHPTAKAGGSPAGWNMSDATKAAPASSPDALMDEIDAAIAAAEYAHATALLESAGGQRRDSRLADQAYHSGCAALSAGNYDEALQFFQSALACCPPEKTAAVAKLRSVISFTSQRIQKRS